MTNIDWKSIAGTVADYKSTGRYSECIQWIDRLLQDPSDDRTLRAILLTAKASCALQLGDMGTATIASDSIDLALVATEIRNYTILTKAAIAQQCGKPEIASALLSEILAGESIIGPQERDVLYEALARKGFALATLRDFGSALEFLEKATAVDPIGEYQDNIDLYTAYCLQALGRLASAKTYVEKLLSRRPPSLEADAHYRLGAIYLQSGALGSAMAAFNCALDHLPGKLVTRVDIINALAEVDKKLTSGSIQ